MPEKIEIMDNVSKKIIEDAQNEAAKIIEAAKKNAVEIIEDANLKREKKLKDASVEAKNIYKKAYDLEMSKARTVMEQEILMQKIELVNSLLEKSVIKIASGNSAGYEKFLEKTLKSLNISGGTYQIGKSEQFITEKVIKKITGSLKLNRLGQEPDFDYGLKIVDGKKEFSISVQTLIHTKIDDIRIELAQFLFEKE
ncbi:MAG: hypothetical protein FJW68_09575 [Actinobacteria bacterium]|nr:hypothetical protein [Actinomycetota bacterium]